MTPYRVPTSRNISPGDIADEIAGITNINLIPGLECIALAISEASFQTRQWVDGVVPPDEVIVAMAVALEEMEGMVHCRRERAVLRRLMEEMRAYVVDDRDDISPGDFVAPPHTHPMTADGDTDNADRNAPLSETAGDPIVDDPPRDSTEGTTR